MRGDCPWKIAASKPRRSWSQAVKKITAESGPRFGKPDRRLRKRADAGGKRPRAVLEIFRRPDAARLQAVRPDPFGGNPRAGEEHAHWIQG